MNDLSTLTPWIQALQGVSDRRCPPLDPMPLFSGSRSIAELVPDDWRWLRRSVLRRAAHACEVCGHTPSGGERRLQAHEAWCYDLAARTQWLDRLWALCWCCHHLAHAERVSQWRDPSPLKDELDHFDRLAARAIADAKPRRLVLFTIDLRHPRTREDIPADVADAFASADAATLPARVHAALRRTFDGQLLQGLEAELFDQAGHLVGGPIDVARVLGEPPPALVGPDGILDAAEQVLATGDGDLRAALASLPEARTRLDGLELQIFYLARLWLTWEEIARALGVDSRQAAQQRYQRLLKRYPGAGAAPATTTAPHQGES